MAQKKSSAGDRFVIHRFGGDEYSITYRSGPKETRLLPTNLADGSSQSTAWCYADAMLAQRDSGRAKGAALERLTQRLAERLEQLPSGVNHIIPASSLETWIETGRATSPGRPVRAVVRSNDDGVYFSFQWRSGSRSQSRSRLPRSRRNRLIRRALGATTVVALAVVGVLAYPGWQQGRQRNRELKAACLTPDAFLEGYNDADFSVAGGTDVKWGGKRTDNKTMLVRVAVELKPGQAPPQVTGEVDTHNWLAQLNAGHGGTRHHDVAMPSAVAVLTDGGKRWAAYQTTVSDSKRIGEQVDLNVTIVSATGSTASGPDDVSSMSPANNGDTTCTPSSASLTDLSIGLVRALPAQ